MNDAEERSLTNTIEIPLLPEVSTDVPVALSTLLTDFELDEIDQQIEAEVSPSILETSPEAISVPAPKLPEVAQVRFKTVAGKLNLLLPNDKEIKDEEGTIHSALTWGDILEQLQQRLNAADRFWQPQTLVYLQAGDRLLDTRQFQEIAEILQSHELILQSVYTFRRQTAINAATAGFSVDQGAISNPLINQNSSTDTPLDDPLYVKMTVRSGTEIRHAGSIVIFGDVNAGGEIIADGDILVWGKLKGVAHAGAKGNSQAVIMALHMEATQLRIGDFIARVDTPTTNFCPEIAHISVTGSPSICIVRSVDYSSSVKYS